MPSGLKIPKSKQGQTPSHARARQQEKQTAKRLRGRTTKASGALSEKGDVRLKGVARIECKTTKHKSFSVTGEMIKKIEDATVGTEEVPIMEIEIEGGKRSCYVMPKWAVELLLEKVNT